ncbi:hypothetical protein BDF21DRAFT_433185 [Thamnidium elegans]|nr:hypothetical protein BDF21DRAFT_433185 [Thamnidium elegans]
MITIVVVKKKAIHYIHNSHDLYFLMLLLINIFWDYIYMLQYISSDQVIKYIYTYLMTVIFDFTFSVKHLTYRKALVFILFFCVCI